MKTIACYLLLLAISASASDSSLRGTPQSLTSEGTTEVNEKVTAKIASQEASQNEFVPSFCLPRGFTCGRILPNIPLRRCCPGLSCVLSSRLSGTCMDARKDSSTRNENASEEFVERAVSVCPPSESLCNTIEGVTCCKGPCEKVDGGYGTCTNKNDEVFVDEQSKSHVREAAEEKFTAQEFDDEQALCVLGGGRCSKFFPQECCSGTCIGGTTTTFGECARSNEEDSEEHVEEYNTLKAQNSDEEQAGCVVFGGSCSYFFPHFCCSGRCNGATPTTSGICGR